MYKHTIPISICLITLAALTLPVGADEAATALPVEGHAEFAAQCPDDAPARLAPLPLALWGAAASGLKKLELTGVLQSLVFMADCKSGILNVQSAEDDSLQATVALARDGSFEMHLGTGYAQVKEDGNGTHDCTFSYTTDLRGSVNCESKDAPVIRAEAIWNLGMGRHPHRDSPEVTECRFPAQAFLSGGAELSQCR